MEYSFVKNGKQPLCVIGDPVAHSLSPAIYNPLIEKYGLNAQYGVMRVPRGDLPRFLAEAAAQGVELLRQGKVAWRPGFDGEYGKLSFPGA